MDTRKKLPSRDYLMSVLHYDPETGLFRWKYRIDRNQTWNTRFANTVCGTKITSKNLTRNYEETGISIRIDTIAYVAHHLAWLYHYGEPVPYEIDHKDTNPLNNRIDNLRISNRSQNMANGKIKTTNTSGVKGVTLNKATGKYQAYITVNRKMYHLGFFDTLEEAKAIRQEAHEKYFGEFARHV